MFSGSIASTLTSLAISIYTNSSKVAKPTLFSGFAYTAAKFDNEWQGFRMYKKPSLNILR